MNERTTETTDNLDITIRLEVVGRIAEKAELPSVSSVCEAAALEVVRLRRDLADMRRAIWALTYQAGGQTTITAHAMLAMRPNDCFTVWNSPDGMNKTIELTCS